MQRWPCAFAQRRVQHEAWPRNECAASRKRAAAVCHPASNDRATSGRGVARPARIMPPIQRAAAAVLHRETTPIIGATKRPPRTISAQPGARDQRPANAQPCAKTARTSRPPCAASAHGIARYTAAPRPISKKYFPALEGLTRSVRTDSPPRIGRKQFSGEEEAAARGGGDDGSFSSPPPRLHRNSDRQSHVVFDETSFRSNSAASLHDLCSRLESTSLDDSDDDVAPQRYSTEMEPALDTPHTNAQQDLTGNPVVIDLTNVDSTQDQISPGVPAVGGGATNLQPAVAQPAIDPTYAVQSDGAQSDVAQKDLSIHQSTADASVASTYQLVSKPTADEQDASTSYQLVSIPTADALIASTSHQLESRPTTETTADPSSHLEQPSQQLEPDAQANNEEYQFAYSKLIYQSAMASSLFVNTAHVCFESVLAMDKVGMVAMFDSLVSTGLKGFLDCPTVIHEAALLEFFENGSVRDGLVVSTVNGVTVEISEQLFIEKFELPVEVSISGKNKEMTIEFRLLCDILAKTISVKAGSFDAITQEKFLMMAAITCGVRINWNRVLFNIIKDMVTPGSRQVKGYAIQISLLLENVPNLELGESSEFPSSKILTENTMHRYVVLNDKVGVEGVTDESRVKKTPVKKAASKKRPTVTTAAEPVMIAPTPVAPAEQPPVPKRKIQKRKRRLFLGSDDEFVEQPAAAEAQNDNNALSLALKAVRTQNVILSTDLEATRKELKDIKAALSKDFDDKLADIRNELLEFRIETQGQLASLSTHLAELISFLTKGNDDKKGEDSSSRRPQPPSDNQSRPSGGSGGSGNREDEQSRPVGSGSRGGSQRRGDRSGSSKRRLYSSGGGPFRRSLEYWLG
ncbi:patatin-like protein 2 [Dorcoceras hygrometricum]|uniref:Patatin-like protein 2 n=1 Tax=Dorcoceras hygrometricum TaxID=472368 RepID=A0A2Z7B198_9LAMI|nr:patatin-like protein 2 [Dorcoceras hygrometricum]